MTTILLNCSELYYRQSTIKVIIDYGMPIVFNATFNNILAVSWRSVLLVEETGVPGENHRPGASQWETLSHNVALSTPRHKLDSN